MKSLKEKICKLVSTEAEQYLGMSMTYSLFEFVKEKFDELIQDQPEEILEQVTADEEINDFSDLQVIIFCNYVLYCLSRTFKSYKTVA